uniref:Uncharacterized protein n=1 Tax=Aegilops tauschii subsp. strangulata TaxID=200361 RepID=A0A453CX05_AEGTS
MSISPCSPRENGRNGEDTLTHIRLAYRGTEQRHTPLTGLSFVRCQICGGSGLDYCHRCHGTGEYREPMGFHFTVNRK